MALKIPKPYYSLFDTSRGDAPAIVVVNTALRRFAQRSLFPWHLVVLIDCKLLALRGMPTAEEGRVLYQIEDEIERLICEQDNAMFWARITCEGKREIEFRVRDPEIANAVLQRLVSAPEQLREWEYRMEWDESWELASPVLQLIERAPSRH